MAPLNIDLRLGREIVHAPELVDIRLVILLKDVPRRAAESHEQRVDRRRAKRALVASHRIVPAIVDIVSEPWQFDRILRERLERVVVLVKRNSGFTRWIVLINRA